MLRNSNVLLINYYTTVTNLMSNKSNDLCKIMKSLVSLMITKHCYNNNAYMQGIFVFLKQI